MVRKLPSPKDTNSLNPLPKKRKRPSEGEPEQIRRVRDDPRGACRPEDPPIGGKRKRSFPAFHGFALDRRKPHASYGRGSTRRSVPGAWARGLDGLSPLLSSRSVLRGKRWGMSAARAVLPHQIPAQNGIIWNGP